MQYGYASKYNRQPRMDGSFASAQMQPIRFTPPSPEEQRAKLKFLGLEDSALDKMFAARSELNTAKQDFKTALIHHPFGTGSRTFVPEVGPAFTQTGGEAIKTAATTAGSALLKAL